MKTSIIAHRGHPPVFHENTMKSFQSAIDHNADFIEFDVRRTADNQLIAFHDPFIENDGVTMSHSQLTFEQLQAIAALHSFSVPRIEEIFSAFSKKIAFDIELKEELCEHDILELLQLYDIPQDKVIFTSFNTRILTTLKSIDPSIKTGFLSETEEMFESAKTIIVDYYCPEQSLYRKHRDFFANAAISGITSAIWTVNDQDGLMEFFKDPGVTAVITNRCDLASRLYTL